jgi:hypothetical protein
LKENHNILASYQTNKVLPLSGRTIDKSRAEKRMENKKYSPPQQEAASFPQVEPHLGCANVKHSYHILQKHIAQNVRRNSPSAGRRDLGRSDRPG